MASKQKVEVQLTAVDKTKAAFNSLNKSLSKTNKAVALLKNSFAGIAAGVGVAGIARFVTSSQKATNQLVDFSKILGDSVTDLSEFTFAMEAAGVASSSSTIALQRQTRRIGEAAQGYGEASKALKTLKLDAQELAALPPTEAFDKISESLLDIDNQSVRLATAFKLWDTEGVKLVSTLEEVDKFKTLAQQSGAIITPVEAQAARDIRDAFSELKAETVSLGQNLTVIFGPVLEFGLEVIEKIVFAFRKFTDGVIWVGQQLGIFDDELVQIERTAAGLADSFNNVPTALDKMVQSLQDGNVVLDLRLRGLRDMADITERQLALESQLGRELGEDELNKLAYEIQLRNEINDQIKEKQDTERQAVQDRLKAERAAQAEIDEALGRQKQFADDVAATMTSAFADAVIEGEKLSDIFDSLLKDLAQMVIRMAVLRPLSNSIAGFIPAFASGTTSAPGGMALVGEQGPEIVNLPKGSQVIPNNKIGGGTVVNVINAPPDTKVEQSRTPDGKELINVVLSEVANSIGNGGVVSRAIQGSFGSRQQSVVR